MGATSTLSAESLLRRLEWRVVRRLDGRLQGDYRTLFRGAGLDFTDLREYVPGDDLRHIEWNVTARLDEPYVREFVEDRELTAWLLLDHSASMGFGPVDRQKDLVLAEVATTLAHVLTRGGSRVGAIVMDTGVDLVIPPSSGRNQVLRIAKTLLDRREARAAESEVAAAAGAGGRGERGWLGRRRARTAGGRGPGGTAYASRGVTDLSVLLTAAAGIARRRSLVLVVSDFITADGWEAPLSRLARRHEVVAIQVVDPRESELPDAGAVYVEDAETGEQIFVDTSDVGFRARLAAAAEARQADLETRARKVGVDLYPVRTDDDLVRSLLRISELRRRRRR
ncbi:MULTISPECIES: DUF58 domain-containing protein [unclassified Terrabacter]|uniref:DUF58 domain-containing protein n=1 Tax=unclassified Terrabacter TaxID=2630222 RepID=UPI0006FA7CF0|nr:MULTISPECIES: DUF58 domain-containing protein [unclassified Terrabacter]KRB47036.1 ATPase [Terrabacter sp. Root181]KRF38088.1 ATPase [Terrabacter sp. Soil810]